MRKLCLVVDGRKIHGFDIELASEKPDFHTFLDVSKVERKD